LSDNTVDKNTKQIVTTVNSNGLTSALYHSCLLRG